MKRVWMCCLILTVMCAAMSVSADSSRSRMKKNEIRKRQQQKNSNITWYTNLDAALKEARQKRCKVFLLITGSTWCGPCKNLERRVLTSKEFARFASENLVLLKVDVPARGAMTPDGQKISAQYRSRGVPAIFILDGNGKVLEQKSGYGGASPKDFLKSFKSF